MIYSLVQFEQLNSNNEVKFTCYSIGIDPPENFYANKIISDSNLVNTLLGKSVGDEFQLGPSKAKINSVLKIQIMKLDNTTIQEAVDLWFKDLNTCIKSF